MALKRSTAIAMTINMEPAMLKLCSGLKKWDRRRSWLDGFEVSMVAPQRTEWSRSKMSKEERAIRSLLKVLRMLFCLR